LSSGSGPARVRIADRPQWIHANVASFRRLLSPLTTRMAEHVRNQTVASIGRNVTGTEMGVLLGWMSKRVLGQYDMLLAKDDSPEDQDIVYFVGPNILALEKRFAFPPKEFRLWIALHEVTHRMQFTGVPWLSGHFRSLVNDILDRANPSPQQLIDAIRRTTDKVRAGEDPLAEAGIAALLASDEQLDAIGRVMGLMALLEGHGEVTMNRAAAERIPSADRFHRVLHARRHDRKGAARFLHRALGFDAKMNQYEQGARFIEEVERVGGRSMFDKVWSAPEFLPEASEIREPSKWMERVEGLVHS
jgi:coenzyme F420 biosynthesis associated uncharacterized protein